MEIVCYKVANAKGEVSTFFDGFRRDTFYSYASIRRNVGEMLIAVDSRLREPIDREAQELQQGDHAALRNVAGGVQKSFGDVLEVVHRSLNLNVGHAGYDETARLESCTTHLSNCEPQQDCTWATADSGVAPKGSTT